MNDDPYHELIADQIEFLTLLETRLSYLASAISINTPVIEMIAMVQSKRQELIERGKE